MTAAGFLRRIVDILDARGVAFMVVGSFASSFHGEPRTTRDLDLVVEVGASSIDDLLAAFDRDQYYVPDKEARSVVDSGGQFNVIDLVDGWKVDVIVRRNRPFNESEFARRRAVVLHGVPVFVATAEDTILAKLEWARSGGSDRQLRDAAGIIEIGREVLDWEYLEHWAVELGVSDLLTAVRPAD